MKVYTYSQARAHLAELLDAAREEEVIIQRKGGDAFSVRVHRPKKSPLDVPPVKTTATTEGIIQAIRESRSREYRD